MLGNDCGERHGDRGHGAPSSQVATRKYTGIPIRRLKGKVTTGAIGDSGFACSRSRVVTGASRCWRGRGGTGAAWGAPRGVRPRIGPPQTGRAGKVRGEGTGEGPGEAGVGGGSGQVAPPRCSPLRRAAMTEATTPVVRIVSTTASDTVVSIFQDECTSSIFTPTKASTPTSAGLR